MITVKRGDTLMFINRRQNQDGTPRTGEASKLSAQVRSTKEVLMADLTIVESDTPGDYILTCPASITKTWMAGDYNCDIEYSDDDFVRSSGTFMIKVEKDVTRSE